MTRPSNMIQILLGIFSAVLLTAYSPVSLHAQAPPGPIKPPQASSSDSSAASPAAPQPPLRRRDQAPPPPRVAPRQDIGGAWKLNVEQSDNGRKKVEEAQRNDPDNGPYGGPGGNGPYGGGPWGGGYPFPGPGGNGPYGGNRGGRSGRDQADSPAMREYLVPAISVTFALKTGEADLIDESGQKRAFLTDGRKLQKSKDENYREIAAHWEGSRLVAQEKDPLGGQIRRSFELSGDGRHMEEYVSLSLPRSRSSVMIHYVYDVVPGK